MKQNIVWEGGRDKSVACAAHNHQNLKWQELFPNISTMGFVDLHNSSDTNNASENNSSAANCCFGMRISAPVRLLLFQVCFFLQFKQCSDIMFRTYKRSLGAPCVSVTVLDKMSFSAHPVSDAFLSGQLFTWRLYEDFNLANIILELVLLFKKGHKAAIFPILGKLAHVWTLECFSKDIL